MSVKSVHKQDVAHQEEVGEEEEQVCDDVAVHVTGLRVGEAWDVREVDEDRHQRPQLPNQAMKRMEGYVVL